MESLKGDTHISICYDKRSTNKAHFLSSGHRIGSDGRVTKTFVKTYPFNHEMSGVMLVKYILLIY